MLSRIKGNKGYYGLLLGDTALELAGFASGIAVINPLLAAVAVTFSVGAALVGGFIKGPQEAALPEETAAEGNVLKRGKIYAKGAFGVIKAGVKDSEFIVSSSAVGAGATLFFQSVLAIDSLLSTHSLLLFTALSPPVVAASVGVCTLLGAAGLFALVAGNLEKWKGLRKFYEKAFNKKYPPDSQKKPGRGFLGKLVTHPLVHKIANSPVTRRIKKPLLFVMALESSLFTVSAVSSVVFKHVAGIAAGPLTAPAILAGLVPAALAIRLGVWPALNLISSAKLATRYVRRKSPGVRGKDAIASLQAPVSAVPQAETASALAGRTITNAFGRTADREQKKKSFPAVPTNVAALQKAIGL